MRKDTGRFGRLGLFTALPDHPDDATHIVCRGWLGGLLKHYERRAA